MANDPIADAFRSRALHIIEELYRLLEVATTPEERELASAARDQLMAALAALGEAPAPQ